MFGSIYCHLCIQKVIFVFPPSCPTPFQDACWERVAQSLPKLAQLKLCGMHLSPTAAEYLAASCKHVSSFSRCTAHAMTLHKITQMHSLT